MGLIIHSNKFSYFSSENSVRFDCGFIKAIASFNEDFYTHKELFDFIDPTKVDLTSLDEFQYAEIGDVSKSGFVFPEKLSFNQRNEVNESLFVKIEKGDIFLPKKGDILISKIRPKLNKNVLIESEDTYFTKAFIQIRPKLNSDVFYFALRTVFFDKLLASSRQGKGYPTIKADDLKSIRFPKIMIDKLRRNEENLKLEIQKLKAEISKLQKIAIASNEIINKVFGDELGFDWVKFEKLKVKKYFTLKIEDFANNLDCRFSPKFHNEAGQYVYDFLCEKTNKRIKDFTDEPIVLGKSVSPSDYDDSGSFFYIAMSNIKNWCFDSDDCQRVSDSYADDNQNKTVNKGDIILARSGEGTIGKVALITEDVNGIFSDFTQRIRLKNYSLEFAYYYFRSDLFQYLVYTHKKGLGNNTNIFPVQINEFPMLDWDMDKQNSVMLKIKTQLEYQNKSTIAIKNKQQEIIALIEDAIKN